MTQQAITPATCVDLDALDEALALWTLPMSTEITDDGDATLCDAGDEPIAWANIEEHSFASGNVKRLCTIVNAYPALAAELRRLREERTTLLIERAEARRVAEEIAAKRDADPHTQTAWDHLRARLAEANARATEAEHELADAIDWVADALAGKDVSDFAVSHAVVRQAMDVRTRMVAALARATAAESALASVHRVAGRGDSCGGTPQGDANCCIDAIMTAREARDEAQREAEAAEKVITEQAATLESIARVLAGEEVSDFEVSNQLVRAVMELRTRAVAGMLGNV